MLMPGTRIAHRVRGSLGGSALSLAAAMSRNSACRRGALKAPLADIQSMARGDDPGEPCSPHVSVSGIEHRGPAWRSG